MIDTVRFPVPEDTSWLPLRPLLWRRTTVNREGVVQDSASPPDGCILTHDASGFRVGGTVERPYWVEGSLPRLLFGSNGRLVTSQAQLDLAEAAVHSLVDSAVDLPASYSFGMPLHRVDLVWHFALDPRLVVDALVHTRWPRCHKPPFHVPGETVTFTGTGRQLSAYDKGFEVDKEPGRGGPLRVEYRLRSRANCQEAGFYSLGGLSFSAAWSVYRSELLTLPVIRGRRPSSGRVSLGEFLAVLRDEGALVGTEPAHLWYLRHLSPRQRREHERYLSAVPVAGTVEALDWSSLLPEGGPPEALHYPLTCAA